MVFRNSFKKFVALITIFALSGVFYIQTANATNDASVANLSGTENNPRIAADGESELAVLGLNLLRGNSDDTVELNSVKVHITSQDSSAEAAVSNIETVRLYRDSRLAGINGLFDQNDALLKEVTRTKTGAFSATVVSNSNANAGKTQIDVTNITNQPGNGATVYVKVGTGETAEILQGTFHGNDNATNDACSAGAGSNTCIAFGVTTTDFDHSNSDAVREVNNTVSANNGDGFRAWNGTELVVELGDPGNTLSGSDMGHRIPLSDLGDFAGNDVFVVFETADGSAGQTIQGQVFSSGDIEYLNNTTSSTVTPAIISAGTTTEGKTKTLTFGPDDTPPQITKVETFDNTADGIVDRIKVYFSESMASSVTGTQNFVNSLGGTSSRIEAGSTDISLEADGTWSTTDVLNDTLTIDFQSTSYSNSARSTGDKWTVRYDEDKTTTDQLKDATGENLEDTSIATTDKARPYFISASVKDNNKNLKSDTLEVVFSETLDTAGSGLDGFELKETALSSQDYTYVLNSVSGFEKSDGNDANSNDTIIIDLQERDRSDVKGTFSLNYTTGSSVLDMAGNEARATTGASADTKIAPVVTNVEYYDYCGGVDGNFDCTVSGANGKIDTVKITFSRAVDTDYSAGAGVSDWTVSAYSNLGIPLTNADPAGANATDGVTELYIRFDEKTFDTSKAPDLTYARVSGDGANICTDNADNDCQPDTDSDDTALESVFSGEAGEQDKSAPYARSATLYDTDKDGIWDAGETLQILFSEEIDTATIESAWSSDTFTDWLFSGGAGVTPDSGSIDVGGKVIVLTPSVDASGSFTGNIAPRQNELKDSEGNSVSNSSITVSINPTTAPGVDRIETRDLDRNGVIDALMVEFNGLIDSTTIKKEDWAVISSSNYSTSAETAPDLEITDMFIEDALGEPAINDGGATTRIFIRFNEASEGTGKLPKLKYVEGSLKDLSGNDISSFNEGADTAKFATSLDVNTTDGANPQVVLKRLQDRDLNGIYDQLIIVFSEAMDTGVTSTNGWSVKGEALASAGSWSSNNGTYDAYTFAGSNNIFKADILEGDVPEFLPSVSYLSSGAFKDSAGFPLVSVPGGNEESNIEISAAPDMGKFKDGDLVRLAGTEDVYIYKKVGDKHFKRLILNPDIFNSYGHLDWADIREDITGVELNLMETSGLILEDGGAKVYSVSSTEGADTGQKQHINMSPDNFISCGYDWDAVYIVNSIEVSDSFYPEGEAISSC